MIASGFTEPAIPVWAREDILEWMFDVPQQTDPYVTQDGFLVFKGPKVPPNFAGSDQLGGHTPEYTNRYPRAVCYLNIMTISIAVAAGVGKEEGVGAVVSVGGGGGGGGRREAGWRRGRAWS